MTSVLDTYRQPRQHYTNVEFMMELCRGKSKLWAHIWNSVRVDEFFWRYFPCGRGKMLFVNPDSCKKDEVAKVQTTWSVGVYLFFPSATSVDSHLFQRQAFGEPDSWANPFSPGGTDVTSRVWAFVFDGPCMLSHVPFKKITRLWPVLPHGYYFRF